MMQPAWSWCKASQTGFLLINAMVAVAHRLVYKLKDANTSGGMLAAVLPVMLLLLWVSTTEALSCLPGYH